MHDSKIAVASPMVHYPGQVFASCTHTFSSRLFRRYCPRLRSAHVADERLWTLWFRCTLICCSASWGGRSSRFHCGPWDRPCVGLRPHRPGQKFLHCLPPDRPYVGHRPNRQGRKFVPSPILHCFLPCPCCSLVLEPVVRLEWRNK